MKNIIIICCSIFLLINNINAFFWDADSLNLYKNIDSWVNELQEKMLDIEINWYEIDNTINKEIHELAKLEKLPLCLKEWKIIDTKTFKNIITNQNIEKMISFFWNECKNNGQFSTVLIQEYMNLFNIYYKDAEYRATKKTIKTYKLSSLGIYSDWNKENSWFDLITDIEEVDKIIFSSTNEYIWEEGLNLNNNISKTIDIISKKEKKKIIYDNEKNSTIEQNNNNYICNNKESWLNNDSNANLLDDILNVGSTWSTNINPAKNWELDNNGDYIEQNDNSDWPCNWFFCIVVEFLMYNHSLLWGWENITIEYLLNRSNKHLKNFAASSWVPAKMTFNNFQINTDWLNLMDSFHMWFQVTKKPVPILNINKSGKNKSQNIKAIEILKKYYDNKWLDYNKRNSITLLKKIEQEKQSILSSQNITNQNAFNKQEEYYQTHLLNQEKQSKKFQTIIEKQSSYWISTEFYNQFSELERFTSWINDYVNNINSIIKNMNKIPID
jgi:hypothetical protein